MNSSKNIKTIEKVSKLCESALIGVNAYDMTAQSLAGLYEEAQKELIDKNKKLKKQVSKLESLCSEIKRTIDKTRN